MPHEWTMLAYLAFTVCFMILAGSSLVNPGEMIKTRVIVLVVLAAGWCINCLKPTQLTRYIRVAIVLMTLGLWYPDTYEMNRLFPSYDHIFAALDQSWFGCQPSLLFSQKMPQWWASELFCMGYFAYFPMNYILVTWIAFRDQKNLSYVAFVILTSFFLYYLIYIFLPVVGPQFYYQAEGVDAANGIFPAMGHYFSAHQELYPMPGEGGVFRNLVEMTQQAGERPTAAFPSSHIGVSTILLLLCYKLKHYRMGLAFLPFYLFLCCATVYIHAHYLVDAIFGFITAFIVYFIVDKLYKTCSRNSSSLHS